CRYEASEFTFDADKSGERIPHKTQANVRLALDLLGVALSHDVFANRLRYEYEGASGNLDDAIVEHLWLETDTRFKLRPTLAYFQVVVQAAARRNPRPPVREYL